MTGMYRSTSEVCLVERRGRRGLHADVTDCDDDIVADGAVLADLQLADEHLRGREKRVKREGASWPASRR